jgi:hypothetical protein
LGNDVKGPPCADVIGGSGSSGGVVVQLAAAPCSAFSYTLYVYSDESMETELAALSNYDPLPENQIGFNTLPGDADGHVCVVLKTAAGGGKHVFDTAPDADAPIGCVDVSTTISPGFGGFS